MRKLHTITVLAAVALAATGCGGSANAGFAGSAGSGSALKIAYFQGAVAGPEAVVAANPDLAAGLNAKIELHPIDSGVAGIAQLRAGALPVPGRPGPGQDGALGRRTGQAHRSHLLGEGAVRRLRMTGPAHQPV